MNVQSGRAPSLEDPRRNCGQPLAATLDMGVQFIVMGAEAVAVFDDGATAKLVRLKWLERRDELKERWGAPSLKRSLHVRASSSAMDA